MPTCADANHQTGVVFVIVVLMISRNSSFRDDASLLSVPAVEKSQTDVLLFSGDDY